MTLNEIEDILDRALAEELGVVVKTTNVAGLQKLLYDHKQVDQKYNCLTIAIPKSNPGHVLVYRKPQEDGLE